jgi:AcrR family transcriptional regulator
MGVEGMLPDELSRLTRMPPGRHHLPRDFVAAHQRQRLFDAIVKLVAERGYHQASLTQIVKTAGVARHTFYELFESKEALFLAVLQQAEDELYQHLVEAAEAEPGPWEAKVRAGLASVLRDVGSDPQRGRVFLVDVQSAGPAALELYEAALHRFAPLLRLGRRSTPLGAKLPEAMEEIVIGGLVWMLGRELLDGDAEDLESLLPKVVEFALTPYLGEAAARHVAIAPGEPSAEPV